MVKGKKYTGRIVVKGAVGAKVKVTETAQPLDLNLSGRKVAGPATLWQVTGANLDAADRVGQPAQVELKESQVAAASQ